jgi:hypothetical protein
MTLTHALYYPWIDVRDATWLKNAVLYWDQVSTIVPEGLRSPYNSRDTQALVECGFVSPFLIDGDSPAVHWASEILLRELSHLTQRRRGGSLLYELFDSSSIEQAGFASLHSSKFNNRILRLLERDHDWPRHDMSPWVQIPAPVASFYMTILASRLAQRSGFAPVTDYAPIASMANSLRLRSEPYELPASRRTAPSHSNHAIHPESGWAEALLATCVLETVRLDEMTPVEDVIDFREEHKNELARFRTAIGNAVRELEKDHPTQEALQQGIRDVYVNEVRPAISELYHTRLNMRLKAAPDLLKAAVFTTAPAILAQAKLGPVATAMTVLAGAGISLTATIAKYRAERRDLLMKNPYSFVLAARAEFGAR